MQAEQQSDLLPCPFCGAVGLDFAEGSTFRWLEPSCAGCGATCGEVRVQTMGDGSPDQWLEAAKKDAIAEWNTRAALSHPSPQGWQPIETCPIDTMVIFGPTKRMSGPCIGMHHSRDGWVTETPSEWASIYPPKEWMPLDLPPPPEQGSKG